MKSMLSIALVVLSATSLLAQKETFDLATYTVPKGWKKNNNSTNVVSYVITNNQKGTYCQIGVYASTVTKGSLQADFESEWQELIVKIYKPTTKPELIPSASENGWDAQGGAAPFEFNGTPAAAMLITMSGHGRCMSFVIVTNTQDYQADVEKFLESVEPTAPAVNTTSIPSSTQSNESASIIGTWGTSASTPYRTGTEGTAGYIKRQYSFNTDGTYQFVTKTFQYSLNKLLLIKENGTYQINGNSITINPQKSVIEDWTKKDGTDKWGARISSQNRSLEKVTYQFTKHYFTGIQVWNLVLQTNAVTQRDGPFSNNDTFKNAWYYSPISANNDIIELPLATEIVSTPPTNTSGFTFTTSNFDDGWVSTVHEDWVQAVKGTTRVLIHYPNAIADAYSPDLMEGLKNAWNVLVAPKYSSGSNLEFKPIHSFESIEFAEGDLVEKNTNKSVHVVLFKKNFSGGGGKYMEFITPNKASFESMFGVYESSATTPLWDKLAIMSTYNKFAVAAADLKGKWTNNFTGMTQYVNAYTGADAGASSHASTELFEFKGDTYHWEIVVADGMVGNIKFQNAKADGKFVLASNWQVKFSNIEGKAKTYDAYFSCIKGARVLWFSDVTYPGYTAYGKKQ